MSKIITPKLILPSRRKLLAGIAATAIGAPFIIGKAKAQIVAPILSASGGTSPPPSGPTLLLHTGGTGGATPTVDVTGANFIVAVVGYYLGAGGDVIDVHDAYSQTYTIIQKYFVSSDQAILIAYLPQGASFGASYYVSIGFSGNPFAQTAIAAFSGLAASPFDQHSGLASAGVTSIQPGSVTPAFSNELVIAGCSVEGGGTATIDSVNSGFTILENTPQSGGGIGAALAYKLPGAPAAVNPTWLLNSGVACVAATAIATFHP